MAEIECSQVYYFKLEIVVKTQPENQKIILNFRMKASLAKGFCGG
jgi:hypothetical protein